jgi:hypothetical protein
LEESPAEESPADHAPAQEESPAEELKHVIMHQQIMHRHILACVEASLRDEETPLLQQQDGFNMAYFSTELKRAVKDAVIQLQRMQAQVEADADGPLQARRRPDEVMARFKLQDKVDDDDKGDDVSSPKLKRCLLALDEDKVFKKQKHRPDEDKVDDDDKGDDVAVDQVAAVQSGLALAATLARNAVQVFRQQVETEGALVDAAKLQLALDLLHEPLLERPVQPLLSAQIAAQAYNIVRDVRKSCAPSCQELGKFAALAMRECLRESALERHRLRECSGARL